VADALGDAVDPQRITLPLTPSKIVSMLSSADRR
jgi:hypothetical protein